MLRCEHELCRKKSLIHFKCKCCKIYCIKHQLPEKHECQKKQELFVIDIQLPEPKINFI